MLSRRRVLRLAALAAPVGAIALAVGCESGVAKEEYESVKTKLASEEQKSTGLQQQLSDLQQQLATKAQGEAGVTKLTWAEPKPTPTAAPTPTPLPAGVTPAPRRTIPAIYSEPVPFSFYVETLLTSRVSPFGIASTPSCVPSTVFKRGARVVWRFEVFDTSTGKRVTDADGSKTLVKIENGDEAQGRFSQRAGGRVPDAPWMWNAVWDIPADYKLGGVNYTIEVTTPDGRTGVWTQPALVAPDGSIDSRLQVVE